MYKTLLVILLCAVILQTTPASSLQEDPPGYVLGESGVYVNSQSPNQFVWESLIFVNTYTLQGTDIHPVDTWHVVDLSSIAPADAKAVILGGELIITHGSATELCDLMVHFRALGEEINYPYKMQTVESQIGSGQRSSVFTIVRLIDGKFEMKWVARANQGTVWSPSRQYPTYCSYGINLSPEGFVK